MGRLLGTGLLTACGILGMASVADAADLAGQDATIYLSVAGGFDKLFDTDFASGDVTGEINFNPGWIAAFAIGTHVFQNFRAEIEVSNQSVALDDEVINGLGRIDLSGDVQILAVMAKLAYDLDLGSTRPFLGVGLGVANFAVDLNAPIQFDDRDTVLAGMGEVGIAVPVASNVEAFGKAQVMVLDNVNINPPSSTATLDHPTTVSALVGLRIGF
jgi:hypothetical protein